MTITLNWWMTALLISFVSFFLCGVHREGEGSYDIAPAIKGIFWLFIVTLTWAVAIAVRFF